MVVEQGDTVSVEYVGSLDDGRVFDKSNASPLKFEVGSGKLIPGFEKAVLGMKKDDEKNVKIPAEQAYGEWKEDLVIHVPRQQLPPDFYAKPGERLVLTNKSGERFTATLVKIGPEEIDFDLNPPLAGQDLNFKIKVVEVKKSGKPKKSPSGKKK